MHVFLLTVGVFVLNAGVSFLLALGRKPWAVRAKILLRARTWRNAMAVRVPRAYSHQSIRAQTILTFVFQEHAVIRASMPESSFHSCSKSIRSPEHPRPDNNNVGVPRAYGHLSIHVQAFIAFVFQEHMVTKASMLKH